MPKSKDTPAKAFHAWRRFDFARCAAYAQLERWGVGNWVAPSANSLLDQGEAWRIEASEHVPHGIRLHDCRDTRLLGFVNSRSRG